MTLRLTSSALALAAMTVPALADVTPEQVWQSWVDYYAAVGYRVTEGGRDRSGDTLTVSDIVIEGGVPESRIRVSVPQVALTDTGDGKVRTVFADSMSGTVSGTNVEDQEFTLPFDVALPGNSMLTSGAVEDMTHEFDYPAMDFTTTAITMAGKETPLPIRLGLENSAGTFHVVPGAPAKYDYAMTTAAATFSGDVTGTEGERMNFAGGLSDLGMSGDMTAPGGIANLQEDMNAALHAGLAMHGVMKSGPISGTFEFSSQDEEGQPHSGAGKYDGKGFEVSFGLSQDGMVYQAGSDAVGVEMTSSDMPFPISYALESGGFDLQMPAMKSDAAQPYKLAYSLAGLTLGDAIWSLFDPEGKLPRDPASLDIDVTGAMRLTQDLFDPANLRPSDAAEPAGEDGTEATEAEDEPSPFEPVEVTINQIALKALGAAINASGALKAPEGGDISTPLGEIHATYEGLNGLIDTLGAMGLIQQDQIMSARMMLMMFAKPVAEGEDKLETRLEFKDGGAIFANGQQVR